jgi:hypothetical protein
MIEADDRLRSELDRLVPIDTRGDWDEIASLAGLKRERARRRWAIAAVALAVAAVLGASTPLGAAVGRGFDDFSSWLTGEPGTPASEEEQQAFDEANAQSWLGFPQGTRLQHLITKRAGDTTIDLFGFRSGSSALCLRLKVVGDSPASPVKCAPLAELRRTGGPARVVIVDYGVGKGKKVAWYGIDRVDSSDLQITAGIATDGVRSVVLEDDAGRHDVPASSNAFLYVAEQPDVGQRVRRIWARTDDGLVAVPFAPAPFAFGGFGPNATAPAAPPIEHHVDVGRIGWLEAHENRGESLDVLPARIRSSALRTRGGLTNVLFGRVLTPDPDRPIRLVLTLNAHRPGGLAAGVCTMLVTRGGWSGGCAPYPEIFDESPISSGLMGGGSGAFVTISGVASDDVVQIQALLADGQRADVPLRDNAFVVDLPRANLPARLVAYDSQDRVIGVSQPWQDFARPAAPARGRATSLLQVTGAGGATAELFVGPSTDGGECAYVKSFVDRQHGGVSVSCYGREWTGPALQLGSNFPPHFVSGRVRADVKTVRLRFADGSTEALTPIRGYVLWAAPEERLEPARAVVAAEGLEADGRLVARQSLAPKGATRSRRSSSQG